jgi:hypothetical protein
MIEFWWFVVVIIINKNVKLMIIRYGEGVFSKIDITYSSIPVACKIQIRHQMHSRGRILLNQECVWHGSLRSFTTGQLLQELYQTVLFQKASALNSFYETETIFTLTQWEPVKLQNVALRLLLLQCRSRAKWTPNLA